VTDPSKYKDSGCKRCAASGGDAAKDCGLTVKPVAGFASADRKLVLKKGSKRITGQSDPDKWIWVEMPGYPAVHYSLAGMSYEGDVQAYFRADGKAVALHLTVTVNRKDRDDEVRVVDVAALHGRADAPKVLRALVAEQLAKLGTPTWATRSAKFATDDASRGAFDAPTLAIAVKGDPLKPYKPDKIDVALTASGVAAYLAFTVTIDKVAWRVTELASFELGAWKIVGGFWSRGMADAEADAKAAGGQLPKVTPLAATDKVGELSSWVEHVKTGDKELGPLGSVKRTDTITFGTQPKERVAGGKLLDAALAGWRKAGFKIAVAIAGAAPHGGWLLLDVQLTKVKAGKSFTLPVRAWLAFEHDDRIRDSDQTVQEGHGIVHRTTPARCTRR
jgi:hypothetical protein